MKTHEDRNSVKHYSLRYEVADLFFEQKCTPKEIGKRLNISRERVYPLLKALFDNGEVIYLPPSDHILEKSLEAKFTLRPGSVTVVDTGRVTSPDAFAARVADRAFREIKDISQQKRGADIGLGLGPGAATLKVAERLGAMMRSDPDAPRLNLVGISSACIASKPEYSCTSFFNLFPSSHVVSSVGLFAEPIVPTHAFDNLKKRPGVAEAFAAKSSVNVVITSMGDVTDEHDLLGMLLTQAGYISDKEKPTQWVGNVMYRPYTVVGPVHEAANSPRAVTLFELEDFVEMSRQKEKRVILIARPCGGCQQLKDKALRPLLQNVDLRVWSDLIVDQQTAAALVREGTSLSGKAKATRLQKR
ncbi:MAG: hypothetical protein P0119_02980 [Nitrospira sp.]|nr:hypothetical protein [Nitrospira sp.]